LLRQGLFGYSCLTRLSDGRVGVLYETGEKKADETLAFTSFSLAWLLPK
jgi:hypothetical protein